MSYYYYYCCNLRIQQHLNYDGPRAHLLFNLYLNIRHFIVALCKYNIMYRENDRTGHITITITPQRTVLNDSID